MEGHEPRPGSADGFSTVTLFPLYGAGYVDPIGSFLTFWCLASSGRPLLQSVFFGLALFTHESALFALPWLLLAGTGPAEALAQLAGSGCRMLGRRRPALRLARVRQRTIASSLLERVLPEKNEQELADHSRAMAARSLHGFPALLGLPGARGSGRSSRPEMASSGMARRGRCRRSGAAASRA